jgi:uncharacterized metal-binding protein
MEGLPFWKDNELAQPYDQSFFFISFHLSDFAFSFATYYLVPDLNVAALMTVSVRRLDLLILWVDI